MIEFGFGARQFGGFKIKYPEEVEFAKTNNFDFIQIWYDAKSGLEINLSENKEKTIKESKFPSIIHAVLDVTEIEEHIRKLIPILRYLGNKELIIHPHSNILKGNEAFLKLINVINFAVEELSKEGITVYLENNSRLNPIFWTSVEIKKVFDQILELEFLLDIAHIDDTKHLEDMVAIKYPKILHIADRHLEVIHEHLPIGGGNIDFEYIFKNPLVKFDGKVIFEVTKSTKDLIESKNKIYELVR